MKNIDEIFKKKKPTNDVRLTHCTSDDLFIREIAYIKFYWFNMKL